MAVTHLSPTVQKPIDQLREADSLTSGDQTTAQLKVVTDVLAEIPKGQYLQALKVQDDWIWTLVDQKGTRTLGWINIQQIANRAIMLSY